MGTSLAIHLRQSDIDKHLGGKSVKLAMTGSNSHEQSFVLDARWCGIRGGCFGKWTTGFFRDAPEIDADIYCRPTSTAEREGIAGYLFNGFNGAGVAVDTRPVDFRRWRTPSRG